jgi:transposase-like protein
METIPNWSASLLAPAEHPDGTARRSMTIVVCPACASMRVCEHDNGLSQCMVRWACRDCGNGWKEPAGLQVTRGYAIVAISF